jgi:hypothetical protein
MPNKSLIQWLLVFLSCGSKAAGACGWPLTYIIYLHSSIGLFAVVINYVQGQIYHRFPFELF